MDSDALFHHAIATTALESIKDRLQDYSNINVESENFLKVLQLSIKNGDEAAFAKLLTCIPQLRLKTRLRVADISKKKEIWLQLWGIFRLFVVSIVIGGPLIIIFGSALYSRFLYMAKPSASRIQTLSIALYTNSFNPFGVWIICQIFYSIIHRFSRKSLFNILDGVLVFLWIAIATGLVSPTSWISSCFHEGLYSLSSLRGIFIRELLAIYIPRWRCAYFSIIFGPDNFLAWKSEVEAPLPRIDHGEVILRHLLRYECSDKALMMQFLDKVIFDNINEECGAGHEIFVWSASGGYLQVVQKLLSLGINVNISFTESNDFRFHVLPSGSALFLAATEGHSEVVKCLLHNGAETNHTIRPPLIGATKGSYMKSNSVVISTYVACVSYLLKAGADPNSVDDKGRSALSWSTGFGQKPILDLLINVGADPNIADKDLRLPIHYAAKFFHSHEVVAALLKKTTNIDSVDKEGVSALTWALWSADCPTIKLLVDATSDVNVGGGEIFGSPLGAASRYCDSSILKMVLEKGADPKVQGGRYENCFGAFFERSFDESIFEDNMLCLELLISHGADPNMRSNQGWQALHIAARLCYRPGIFEVLLKHGADVNSVYQSSKQSIQVTTTPLGILCGSSINEDATMMLLKAGANPNCYTLDGRTVLQAACDISGSSKTAKELIIRGADITARSARYNKTALHYAATSARSDILKVLLEKGADVNARDNTMETPLHDACWQKPDRETLQEKEANLFEMVACIYRIKEENELLQSIELLLTLGHADSKAKDIEGATPLHHAIRACNPLSVKALIKFSPSDIIFETDSQGKLPLHLAAEAGFTEALDYLVDIVNPNQTSSESRHSDERENLLKAKQESVNVVDIFGNTALHYAAKDGHENFITRLFSLSGSFIDMQIRNYEGCAALDLAKANNHVWIVAAFKKFIEVSKFHRTLVTKYGRESRVFEAQNNVL